MKRHIGVLALVISNMLSGINSPVIRHAMQSMSPYLFGFLRVSLAFVVIAPIAYVLRKRRPKRKQAITKRDLGLTILGAILIFGVANLAFYIGIQHTTSINAAIIILLWPIIYFLGSIRVLKERFNKRAFTGIGLAFGGAILAVAAPVAGGVSTTSASIVGGLFIVACILFDILGTMINKKVLARVHPLDVLAIGLFVSTVYYAFLAWPYISQLSLLSQPDIRNSVLYGVLAVGCLGYGLGNYGLKVTHGADVSITAYLQPITAIIVAAFFFNESFTPTMALGTAAVFLGLYLVEARKLRHNQVHGVHR